MSVWRVQLKPGSEKGISYSDLLAFCKDNGIIGVGWYLIEGHTDDYDTLHTEAFEKYGNSGDTEQDANNKRAAFKAVNAIRKMKKGDLVWTRLGGGAYEYYLCKVGDRLWKDRVVTDVHRKYDMGNFVSAKWVQIGKGENVPGKVINSFNPAASAQGVDDVEEISKLIWNNHVADPTEKYEISFDGYNTFWDAAIDSESLECLVLLYLQSKGYYLYSSSIKASTGTIEGSLIANDGSHRAYPQVKRATELDVRDYVNVLSSDTDKVFLFTTSEKYGSSRHPQIECITRKELETFMIENPDVLPDTVRVWLDIIME